MMARAPFRRAEVAAFLLTWFCAAAGCGSLLGIDNGQPESDASAGDAFTGDGAMPLEGGDSMAGHDGSDASEGDAPIRCEAGAACMPTDRCHTGTMDCSGTAPSCKDTGHNATNGTSCGTNEVCRNGACVACATGAACTPTNVCHAGATDCSTGVPLCTDTGVSLSNGSTCGTGMVCETGVCSACPTGGACTPAANPCHTGTLNCSTSPPTCGDTGTNAAN